MSQQRHVIKRQTVEITMAKHEDAWSIQQTLSLFFQQHFPAMLDRCLSELSQPDCLHRIDRLELDLGELEAGRLEADIFENIEICLRQALHECITAHGPSITKQQSDPLQDHFELFEHFVREGCLPWWADSSRRHMPEMSFTALLNLQPRNLARLLVKLIQETHCLRRLIGYFEDDHLQAMLILISALPEASATSLVQTLKAVQSLIQRHCGASDLQLRTTRWQSLLQVAVADEPQVAHHRQFLTAVFARWSILQGISRNKIFQCLQQLSTDTSAINNPWLQAIKPEPQPAQRFATVAANAISKRYSVLRKQQTEQAPVVNELASTINPAAKFNESISHDNGAGLSERKSLPDRQIRRGRNWQQIEAFQGSHEDSEETLASEMMARMQKEKQGKDQLSKEYENKDKIRLSLFDAYRGRFLTKRAGDHFSEATALRSSEHQPGLAVISRRYRLLNNNRLEILPGQFSKPFSEPVTAGMKAAPSHPHPVTESVEDQRFDRPSTKNKIFPGDQTGMEPTPEKQTLSLTDALYVNNAGLCILWPFLGAFFEHLELVENGRFHNLAAKHHAVSLLHYLATEELNSPEYMLTFNKLLCGMDLTGFFDNEATLTSTQTEACDELLSEVIANAPILNTMSINGFRGSFLLRQGVLRAGPGSWLLFVERKPYDLVLDRFPWSWQWLKLPWMEYPLRVEW